MRLPVTNIQYMSTHDGPGLRTTVFLQGCPLHCIWCHNPETSNDAPPLFFTQSLCIGCGACAAVCPRGAQIVRETMRQYDAAACNGCGACVSACPTGALEATAKEMTIEEIIALVERDRPFYGKTGGVTLSGGEPLYHLDEAKALLKAFKAKGISTAVETCGVFPNSAAEALAELVDLFLWDYKDTDPARHKKNTGSDNRGILRNLFTLDQMGAKIRLRCILIEGVNFDETHLCGIADTYGRLRHGVGVDLLPYHTLGDAKLTRLGRPPAGNRDWIPTRQRLLWAQRFLLSRGVPANLSEFG